MRKQSHHFTLTGKSDDFQKAVNNLGDLLAILEALIQTDFDECPRETANWSISGAKTLLSIAFETLSEMKPEASDA